VPGRIVACGGQQLFFPALTRYLLDDGVAARYEDERLVEIVSARSEGRAFRVDASGEHPLEVRVLG